MSVLGLAYFHQPCYTYGRALLGSRAACLQLCLRLLVFCVAVRRTLFLAVNRLIMGNEGSLPSDTESQVSDWNSLYSYGSRAGRRSSLGSVRIPSPIEPPEPDLSHLSAAEICQIQSVIGRAKEMKAADDQHIRKLEEEYVNYAADVEKRASEVAAASPEIRKDTPLCPICMKNELTIKEGKMKEGQNVCVDCGNLTCLECGSMQQSVTSKEMEWVCHMCYKRRQLVLTSGMWHPGCDVHDDVPLAKEIEEHMQDLETLSQSRGPLVRSASLETAGAQGGYSRSFSLQRQASIPGYRAPVSFGHAQGLEIIQETGLSGQAELSPELPHYPADSPISEDLQRSATGSGLKGAGHPSSRSESEYSDGISDVDMEDVSLSLYITDATATDDVSPDDGSDEYSFMSIESSDDGSSRVRHRHRPKSLNLSRSHSASSSDDERTDSEVSTDIESKYNAVAPPEPHDIRIALAASAFVEEMRVVDMANETDEEVAQLSALDMTDEAKRRFSPSAPISPSWREGLDSPPFSPRRRDSYPGKKRGTSPISPKDKHFMYSDMSPPSRQLSLEELYDIQAHVITNENTIVPFAQRPSPKSPDEVNDSFYSNSGQILSFDKPASNMKKSKPFYSLDTAQDDELENTPTIMDLAAYAASVASSTANLTSMTISPTNVEHPEEPQRLSPESQDSVGSTSPVSPEYYDNAPYPDEARDSDDRKDTDTELADPSQKSIDYQGTKRQKARPPTTDWSPVIDLSPILDVSPSLEEAEQAEMLAQQQEERQRQASKEEEDEESINTFALASQNQKDVEYMYYGLKRYAPVEDISELVRQNNDIFSPDRSSLEPEDNDEKGTINALYHVEHNDNIHSKENELSCIKHSPVKTSDTVVKPKSKLTHGDTTNTNQNRKEGKNPQSRNRNIEQCESLKKSDPHSVVTSQEETNESQAQSHNKIRRKLPEPTPEIIATQRQPVPKPRRKERPAEPPPLTKSQRNPKSDTKEPSRKAPNPKSDTKEPSRKAPILDQSVLSPNLNVNANNETRQKHNQEIGLQKQDSDERKRTAKDMKAKPDPFVIRHIETEEASASPQYKVLESPPSPESKSMIRREYSDSTSVSPSSSPDRDVYLYPSPVTPPDSDSSPPKPHSPSSGTDFEEEGVYLESPLFNSKGTVLLDNHISNSHQSGRNVEEKVRMFEKEGNIQAPPVSRPKPTAPISKEQKTKEMKKIRRKLPQIPPEDETSVQHKPKTRPQPARKPSPKTDSKTVRKHAGASSTSDDSSMNEDDKEVASIIRKKSINDLDKPSQDKRNGNYLQAVESSSMSSSNGYCSAEILKANIPPDNVSSPAWKDTSAGTYMDETDLIIDSLIRIYGEPITNAMKGLKKRLQEELRRVTQGRRRRIDDIEEIRALTLQIGELKLGADKNRNANVAALNALVSNGKKRVTANSRSSPQVLPRRAKHKRQSSDPMIAKFSPIKEDKDIESEMQGRISDDNRSNRATDDSSQSGISDTDSIRSEPIQGVSCRHRKVKPSDYAKMFYSKENHSTEELDNKNFLSNLISSQSEGNIPLNAVDEETRIREAKRRELQFEIEKRKRQLAEKTAQLKETRASMSGNISGTSKHLAHSCDELPRRTMAVAYIPPRPIPTGIIKPIDDENDNDSSTEYADSHKSQAANYSSTEYLAHKQEELLKQRFEELGAYSTPYLYSGSIGEKSAFVPPVVRTNLDQFSYSTGDVNVSRDSCISCSVTLPEIHNVRSDIDNNNRQPSFESDTNSSPHEVTPAMPLLTDITSKSRRIIHEIGSGSRPVSAEFNLGDVGVDELLNGIYRVESDNSVDADEPIMKHMTEGGVTILKQLERKKQPAPTKPKKYTFSTKRILLTTDPKDRLVKGRQGNSIGMKIVGGKQAPGAAEVGAYVATIYKGGVAERLHGELQEGDQILEWNGVDLSGKSYEEVQQVISLANGEIELVVRPSAAPRKLFLQEAAPESKSCHSSYDNLDSDEDSDRRQKPQQGVDPRQLAAQLEEIQEAESPCVSQSSSQHETHTPSASSACSSPRSDHTSTSSDQRQRRKPCKSPDPREHQQLHPSNDQHYRSMNHTPNTAPRQKPDRDRPEPKPRQRNHKNITKSPECQRRAPKSPAPRHRNPPAAPERTPRSSAGTSPSHHRDNYTAQGGEGKEPNRRISASRSLEQKRCLTPVERCQDQRPQLSASRSLDAQRTLSPAVSEQRLRKVSAPAYVDTSEMLECTRRGREMGDIRLQLRHDETQHMFKVLVKQARNLLPKDFNGLSDPFVKIYLLPGRCSDNKRRTKHVPRTLHPEWNETIVFPNVHVEELRNKTLEVTVWDYDRFKTNDFLGEAVLDLSEDGFLDNMTHWYPLCEHDDSKGVDLPRPTVLPPRSGRQSASPQPKPRSPRSPRSSRAKSKDRIDKTVQNNGERDERIRHGLGRRRRSFGTLVDVDKV